MVAVEILEKMVVVNIVVEGDTGGDTREDGGGGDIGEDVGGGDTGEDVDDVS